MQLLPLQLELSAKPVGVSCSASQVSNIYGPNFNENMQTKLTRMLPMNLSGLFSRLKAKVNARAAQQQQPQLHATKHEGSRKSRGANTLFSSGILGSGVKKNNEYFGGDSTVVQAGSEEQQETKKEEEDNEVDIDVESKEVVQGVQEADAGNEESDSCDETRDGDKDAYHTGESKKPTVGSAARRSSQSARSKGVGKSSNPNS